MRWEFKSARAALLLTQIVLTACGREEGRVLEVTATVDLAADSAATLAIDSGGHFWLGVPGAILVRDSASSVRIFVPGAEAPRVLGWMEGRVYLRTPDRLAIAEPGHDSVRAVRPSPGEGPVLLDADGGRLLQATRTGAVNGYDPETLEPIWGWPDLALASTALALSRHGDRLYQAVGTGEDRHRVLIRDMQTGRVTGTAAFTAPFQSLVSGPTGVLYGVVREGRGSAVLALRHQGDELALLWRTRLRSSAEGTEPRLKVDGGRVAVWGLGPEVGLRLLDARTGAIIARTVAEPLDFAFGPGLGMWGLYPGELRGWR